MLRSWMSVGDSSRAAGRSCVINGFVLRANAVTRCVVMRDSSRKVGRIVKISWSRSLRSAVVAKTRFEFSISERSCVPRSVSASKTVPVLRTSRVTSPSCSSRIARIVVASRSNGARLPSALFRSRPRPPKALPCSCSQLRKASRVSTSKARKISSSWTVSAT
jgi:hypothetical protein